MRVVYAECMNNIYKAQNTKVSKRYTENFKLPLTLNLKLQHNDKKIQLIEQESFELCFELTNWCNRADVVRDIVSEFGCSHCKGLVTVAWCFGTTLTNVNGSQLAKMKKSIPDMSLPYDL